jgi:hypothetical protein
MRRKPSANGEVKKGESCDAGEKRQSCDEVALVTKVLGRTYNCPTNLLIKAGQLG